MKTILITGTSSGFGFKFVEDLLESGHKVIATLRNLKEREDLFSDLKSRYGDHLDVIELDVTKTEDRSSVVQYIDKELNGSLDILINNAGYGAFGALEDFSEKEIRQQMEVNFFAPTILIKELLPFLRRSKGMVINISSIMGQYSFTAGAVYSASKYALNGISEGLKYELLPHGVKIVTLEPGGHKTNFMKSVKWAEKSFSPDSPYLSQSNGLKSFMDKLQALGKSPSAENVSKRLIKLVEKDSVPVKVPIGLDANMIAFMKKILPEFIFNKLMNIGNKMMVKEA